MGETDPVSASDAQDRTISLLSRPVWEGIGVVFGIVLTLIGFYLSNGNLVWLYLGSIPIILLAGYAAFDQANRNKRGWYILFICILIAVCGIATWFTGREMAVASLQPTIDTLRTSVATQQSSTSPSMLSQDTPADVLSLLSVTSQWETIIVDNYNRQDGQWDVSSHEDKDLKQRLIIERKYRWEIWSSGGYVEKKSPKDNIGFTKAYIEVDIQKVQGRNETGYGLLFLSNNKASEATNYTFFMNNLGQYSIIRSRDGSEENMREWEDHQAIRAGERNRMGILCDNESKRIILFINNHYITQIPIEYLKGSIALITFTDRDEKMVVEFDNFKIQVP